VLLQQLDIHVEEIWIWQLLSFLSLFSDSSSHDTIDPAVLQQLLVSDARDVMTPPASLTATSAHLFFRILSLEPIAINLSFETNPTNKGSAPELRATSVLGNILMFVLGSVGAIAGTY